MGYFLTNEKNERYFLACRTFPGFACFSRVLDVEFPGRAGTWHRWAGLNPWALECSDTGTLLGVLPTFPSNGGWSICVQYSFPVIGLSAVITDSACHAAGQWNSDHYLSERWCFAPGSWLDKFLSLSFSFLDVSSVLLSLWYFSWKALLWRLSVVLS